MACTWENIVNKMQTKKRIDNSLQKLSKVDWICTILSDPNIKNRKFQVI